METLTNDKLGQYVTKLWNDYERGLILWTEFQTELMSLLMQYRLIG